MKCFNSTKVKSLYLFLKDMEIDFLDSVDTKPDYSWLDYSPSEHAATPPQQQPLPPPTTTTTTTVISLPSQQAIVNKN